VIDVAAGDAAKEKLPVDEIVSENVVLVETVPLVPVTVTVYVPAVAEVDDCNVRLLELIAAITPGENE